MNDVILMAVDARSTDLVRSDDGTLHLLELELVEPELFFRLDACWVNAWQRISSGS